MDHSDGDRVGMATSAWSGPMEHYLDTATRAGCVDQEEWRNISAAQSTENASQDE